MMSFFLNLTPGSLVLDCLASNGQTSTSHLQRLLWSATAGVKIIFLLLCSQFLFLQIGLICLLGDGKRTPARGRHNRTRCSPVSLDYHGYFSSCFVTDILKRCDLRSAGNCGLLLPSPGARINRNSRLARTSLSHSSHPGSFAQPTLLTTELPQSPTFNPGLFQGTFI